MCRAVRTFDIADDVQVNNSNYTRFISISKNPEIYPGANKVSLMLSLPISPAPFIGSYPGFPPWASTLQSSKAADTGSDFNSCFT
jgi:hypothetical protein